MPQIAAVLHTLSAGERIALAVYETVRDFFDATRRALAFLFGQSPNVAIAPIQTATTTSATSTAPARVIAVNNYPTYTTVVRGVSEDFMNQSLASLRTNLLATVAGMVQPIYTQTVTNATTIQQVNMIQDLSNLIVRNGDFRNSIFDSGVRVSATSGNFTTLVGGTTSLGSTTITGLVATNATTTSATSTNLFATNLSATNFTSYTAPVAPSFTATSTTATSTFAGSLAVDTNGFVYATSTKNVGIGVLSPAALLAIQNSTSTQPIFVASNAAGTEVYRITNAGFVGIGTTTPGAALAVEGSSLLGNSATAGYFTATSTATSTFAGSLAIGTTTPFGTGLFTLGTSTPLLYVSSNTGNVGIGTSSPSSALAVAGNFMLGGSTGAVFTGTGAGITFTGTGNHDITVSGGTLRIGSNTIIGNIEALDDTVDIGTPSIRFDKIYANEVNATTLVGTTTDGNLTAETFTINSDNATADTESSYLAFERGSVTPNATLSWNSAGSAKRFEFNQSLYIENASASTTLTTLDLKSVSGQSADIFRVASSSSATLFNITAAGNIGIGTTSPYAKLSVEGASALGNSATAGYFTATTSTASVFPYASTTALTVSGAGGLQLATGLNGPPPGKRGPPLRDDFHRRSLWRHRHHHRPNQPASLWRHRRHLSIRRHHHPHILRPLHHHRHTREPSGRLRLHHHLVWTRHDLSTRLLQPSSLQRWGRGLWGRHLNSLCLVSASRTVAAPSVPSWVEPKVPLPSPPPPSTRHHRTVSVLQRHQHHHRDFINLPRRRRQCRSGNFHTQLALPSRRHSPITCSL